MPELPDIELYLSCLRDRIVGKPLEELKIYSLFLVRSPQPQPKEAEGRKVVELRRLGKRIVFRFEGDHWWILHLMIAGRLSWRDDIPEGPRPFGKDGLAAFRWPTGWLVLTEAGSKKRASLYTATTEAEVLIHDPGGLEVMTATPKQFKERLLSENRTLKRALTSPKLFSGIGNAYSDEILFAARLSPMRLTSALSDEEIKRLHKAAKQILTDWSNKLADEFKGKFPARKDVTAFRPDFTVHGRHKQPCTICGQPIQRIRYADNECNYCAKCQNEGRLLADRSLSRLLKSDWPRTLDELESRGG